MICFLDARRGVRETFERTTKNAQGLPVMDKNLLSKGGSSDPIATLTVGAASQKSSVKKKELAPVWAEAFGLPCEAGDVLKVEVHDYDLVGANDFMGSVEIPAGEFFESRAPSRRRFELTDATGPAEGA